MNEKLTKDGVDLADRDGYRFWGRDVLRFADLDPNGHVNNIAYAVFCENGRVEFRESHYPKMETGAGTDFVIVRFAIDYIGALYYPGVVEVGTRALGVGRSSYRLGQGLFGEDRQCKLSQPNLHGLDCRHRPPRTAADEPAGP